MNAGAPPLVSIVIVVWNSAKYLPRCLESLQAQSFRDFELIVVDNGSSDHCTVGLEDNYLGLNLRVVRQASNLGFAAGNNLGAGLAGGKWLVLLNADAFPEADWLSALIDASSQHENFSSFSSRQVRADDSRTLDGAGDAYHISGLAWRIGFGYPADRFGLESKEIFSPCAAAAMYLREAFWDVGGFDEDFFSYFEDVDLGFRLRLKGYRCLYVPGASVLHVGASAVGSRSDFSIYHSQRNMIWTFVKNMPGSMLLLYLPAHLMANLVHFTYYALHGRGKVLWQAKLDAFRKLPETLKKRSNIQGHRKASPAELKQWMQHGLLEPYLLGRKLKRSDNS